MNTFRIVEKRGRFYPQERFLYLFWINIFFQNPSSRGGFPTYSEAQGALSEHIIRIDSHDQ